MNVIINNTAISNFAFVDRLDLLKSIFSIVYLTFEVFQEIIKGIDDGFLFQERSKKAVENQGWLQIVKPEKEEIEIYNQLLLKLHTGEASCIAIAKRRNWLFITDDKRARKIANTLRVNYTGTIGVLSIAVKQKLISFEDGNIILHKMIDNGYYSPVFNLSEFK